MSTLSTLVDGIPDEWNAIGQCETGNWLAVDVLNFDSHTATSNC